jgi:LysM repeat protein
MKTSILVILILAASLGCQAQVLDNEENSVSEKADQEYTNLTNELRELLEVEDGLKTNEEIRIETLSRRLARKYGVHMVRRGDTLSALAMRYKTTISSIQKLNPYLKYPQGFHVTLIIRIRN